MLCVCVCVCVSTVKRDFSDGYPWLKVTSVYKGGGGARGQIAPSPRQRSKKKWSRVVRYIIRMYDSICSGDKC